MFHLSHSTPCVNAAQNLELLVEMNARCWKESSWLLLLLVGYKMKWYKTTWGNEMIQALGSADSNSAHVSLLAPSKNRLNPFGCQTDSFSSFLVIEQMNTEQQWFEDKLVRLIITAPVLAWLHPVCFILSTCRSSSSSSSIRSIPSITRTL